MATRKTFQNGFSDSPNEQNLLHDLVTECIQLFGQDCYYIVRNRDNEDKILNELKSDSFTKAYCIETYIVPPGDSFQGDEEVISQFGFEMREQIDLIIPRRRFIQETGMSNGPNAGDLMYWGGAVDHLFEIKKVEYDSPFYSIGTIATWTMHCQNFRYNYQVIKTGIPQVDRISQHFDVQPDGFANNSEFHTQSRHILDFNEKNPFGTY